jgi:1,4-alpha-glucan branching enzyme
MRSKKHLQKGGTRKMSKNGNTKERVTFKFYAPEAGNVSVVGSFNNWDIFSHPLKRNNNGKEDGEWQKAIYLEPGTHEYRFVVDGVWNNDPSCGEFRANEFGSSNCVLHV